MQNMPGGKLTVRTTRTVKTVQAGWFDALPVAVQRHLTEAGLVKPMDFAMSFTSAEELEKELVDDGLSEEDVGTTVQIWADLREEVRDELKKAKLLGASSPSLSNTASGLSRHQSTRIRTFQLVLGKDGHRHGMASSKRQKPTAPTLAMMPQQTYDDIIDVLVRVGAKSTRPLPGLVEDEQSARLFLARSLQCSSERQDPCIAERAETSPEMEWEER